MVISVINKKGGVGKTPFAFSIAKDLDMFLQSNDNSIIESIYPNKAKISKEPSLLENCVYDFGGFVDKGILDIVRQSDMLIIPCNELYNSILRTIETINEIQTLNKNIIVLVSDYKDEKDKNIIEEMLKSNLSDLEFFFFKHSKIIDNAMIAGLSFTELYNENVLSKLNYKNFFEEYNKLLHTLTKTKENKNVKKWA
ncbi:hypothetical protein [Campylobacter sp. MIT 97-5078]|uniref:hypothetical protein n=1 Tax=Campylobacter sp. MIT 97-5078 TaxID=1548153 RepID=UPI000513EFA8|nr:hypothetical protein [Campylobacter sp. MIT 97-5078]KGI55834.1 hypothetical protein LR59_10180 [Campylobacter sp. MIT 97-5078]KGI56830.1 hypothetical protein LR59_04945 [Campylobacter sp. MIT 97-5078]TQR25608.1 hypothetical protein DMB91_07335 [Campylobacter sp. MIT 97-5078]